MKRIILFLLLLALISGIAVVYASERDSASVNLNSGWDTFSKTASNQLKLISEEAVPSIRYSAKNENSIAGYDLLMPMLDIPIRFELTVKTNKPTFNKQKNSGILNNQQQIFHKKQGARTPLLVVNSYYKFYNESNFTPYVSIGFGAVLNSFSYQTQHNKAKAPRNELFNLLKSNSKHFIYTLGFGYFYDLGNRWSAEFGANYLYNKDKITFDRLNKEHRKINYDVVNFIVGATYRF